MNWPTPWISLCSLFSYCHGSHQNISVGSSISRNAGLVFATIESNLLIQVENFLFFNISSFKYQLFIGISFIWSKNNSGAYFFLLWILFRVIFHCIHSTIDLKIRNMGYVFTQRFRWHFACYVYSKRFDRCHKFWN